MTPKEKAKELFNKYADEFNFDSTYRNYKQQSKQCALIAVDEIIKEKKECSKYECYGKDLNFWQEVKKEIEKL
jgi:hypothetical protein